MNEKMINMRYES